MANDFDIDQRLDILAILSKAVIDQDSDEISKSLRHFKTDNVQWVLNRLFYSFEQIKDSLHFEFYQLEDLRQKNDQN